MNFEGVIRDGDIRVMEQVLSISMMRKNVRDILRDPFTDFSHQPDEHVQRYLRCNKYSLMDGNKYS